ncbi:MAG: hypothetical protein JJ895_06350 [Balneolaceae bacterium]|nr:hypothetical protein [Balneolaceae bacterium]
MRIWLFIFSFFVVSANSSLLFSQIIGDDALHKVQSGQTSTLEGEFIAYLADTVSPDYATAQLEALGFELGYIDIQPFTIAIVNQPDSEVLNELTTQPEVLDFEYHPDLVDSAYFRDLVGSQDLSPEEARAALERIIQSQRSERLFIRFNYSMDERAVKTFMGNFRSVAYEIISDFPRTINILVEPGTEKDQMLVVEELPFVKYTALIGIIGE